MALVRCSRASGSVLNVHEMVDEGIGTGSKIARACPAKDIRLAVGENDIPDAAWDEWCAQYKPDLLPQIMASFGVVRLDHGGPQPDNTPTERA